MFDGLCGCGEKAIVQPTNIFFFRVIHRIFIWQEGVGLQFVQPATRLKPPPPAFLTTKTAAISSSSTDAAAPMVPSCLSSDLSVAAALVRVPPFNRKFQIWDRFFLLLSVFVWWEFHCEFHWAEQCCSVAVLVSWGFHNARLMYDFCYSFCPCSEALLSIWLWNLMIRKHLATHLFELLDISFHFYSSASAITYSVYTHLPDQRDVFIEQPRIAQTKEKLPIQEIAHQLPTTTTSLPRYMIKKTTTNGCSRLKKFCLKFFVKNNFSIYKKKTFFQSSLFN